MFKDEGKEAINYLTSEKNRLEALIKHLEGPGGVSYDSASPYVFNDKSVPQNLSLKTASDFLQEYKDLLKKVETALEKEIKSKIN